jgi:flavin-dependent dehydrogenase
LNKVRFCSKGYSLFFSDSSEITVRREMDDSEFFVYVLPRKEFDAMVLEKALSYKTVDFQPNSKAHHLIMEGHKIVGVAVEQDKNKLDVYAPLVIDACGANSNLAVQVGAGNQDPHGCALAVRGYYEDVEGLSDTVEFYFDEKVLPGYYWIFPTSATTANIGCGTFQHIIEERQIDLYELMNHFFTNHPVAQKKLHRAKLCGNLSGGKIPLAVDYENSRVRDGFLMTGDAGSFTDPITAEGISYALNSGIMAGETAIQALDEQNFSQEFLHNYDKKWKTKFGSQFSKAPSLTKLLEKDIFSQYLKNSFETNIRAQSALGNLATQYELMFKLKAIMKSI